MLLTILHMCRNASAGGRLFVVRTDLFGYSWNDGKWVSEFECRDMLLNNLGERDPLRVAVRAFD